MNRIVGMLLTVGLTLPVGAQRVLNLDSCRQMALRNNKQLSISKFKQDVAVNLRKSARTKYLPRVSAIGTYQHFSDEISLLSDVQKYSLSNIGTAIGQGIGESMAKTMGQLPQPQFAQSMQQMGLSMEGIQQLMGQGVNETAAKLNALGQKVVDDFRTDTRNVWAGSILLTQPLFMGGSIVALNKMASINEQLASNSQEARRQATLYKLDQAYWQVVSLNHKKKLAESYLSLVKKLDDDVHKMIDEGVATRSDGLSVDVKVNEAEMALTKVNDGLVLSRMLLCQLCGLPLDEQISLTDEADEHLTITEDTPKVDVQLAEQNRPELKMLRNTVDMSKQVTNILKAGHMPQVALTGGYSISNPNLMNGFQKSFAGFWNVGVLVRIPILNWGDVMYKVRASKGATSIANLELEEARELIDLQVNQTSFKVDEASKKLRMAQTNIKRAEENLRTANLGFREGVITPTTVMEAQTAWLQAKSQIIDAEIDVKLSHVDLQKALGTLE